MEAEKTRVLLVEDNQDDALLLTRQLARSTLASFTLVHVETLAEAKRRMAGEPVDVVLLDLRLPDSAGIETFQRMALEVPRIPIVVLTGLEDERLGISAVQGGAGGYLIKGQTDAKLLVRSLLYAIEWSRARRAEERLRQAEKLEAVGLLAQGIAHHFYNALMVILGNAELLEGELPDGHPRDLVQAIARSGERAAAVTRGLMAFSRPAAVRAAPGEVERRSVDLNAMVEAVLRLTRPLVGGSISIVTACTGAPLTACANPADIEQIILNLVMNARDAMPRGGVLTLATSGGGHAPGSRGERHSVLQGPFVKLSVTDTGPGIDPDVQRHLFEPFFTTKKVGQGVGLGLAAVYGLVKESGGLIQVTSEPGSGSTFEVYLPAADGDADGGGSHHQAHGRSRSTRCATA